MKDFNESIFIEKLVAFLPYIGKYMVDTQKALDVELKVDLSPVTQVDIYVHEKVSHFLAENTSGSVLSEEGKESDFNRIREAKNGYWLLDPLDGTKEYIKQRNSFCVSAGWVIDNKVQYGFLYLPAEDTLYIGGRAFKSKKISRLNKISELESLPINDDKIIYTSHSHRTPQTHEWVLAYEKSHPAFQIKAYGSAIKFAKVAESKYSIYPRVESIMEWDVAGGHAVLLGAGKNLLDIHTKKEKEYGAVDFKMGNFLAQ